MAKTSTITSDVISSERVEGTTVYNAALTIGSSATGRGFDRFLSKNRMLRLLWPGDSVVPCH